MTLTLSFKTNTSDKFEEVCMNCQKFPSFFNSSSTYYLNLEKDDIRRKKNTIKGILNRIRDWDETELFIDKKPANVYEIENLIDVILCEDENSRKSFPNTNCSLGEGWGCFQLNSILYKSANGNNVSLKNWYDYGSFDKGDWLIDKKAILKRLKDEADQKHVNECRLFSEDKMKQTIDLLPSRINPNHDPNWEFKYKESSDGVWTQEIVGVQPRKSPLEGNPFGDLGNLFSGSSPFSSLFDMFKDMGSEFSDNDTSDFSSGPTGGDFFSDLFGSTSTKRSKSNRSIPTTTFNDIGGMDKIIEQVREVIELPVLAPELLEYYAIKPHKGVLLYGPPGCGKTLLAKAVANEINAHFISINGPEILNKYLGQSEENLRTIFNEAKSMAPSIIYFDEFDSLATHRNEQLDPLNARIVNQILTLLDGMDDKSQICVIASTNRIDMIDEAIKRPGRFDYVLEVTKPTLEGCQQIFNIYTDKMPIENGFDKNNFVKTHLFGSTGAEIAFVATEAAYNSIRRTVNMKDLLNRQHPSLGHTNEINEQDFLKAVESLNENRTNKN